MASVDQTMMKVQRLLTGPMGLRIELSGELIIVRFTDVSTQVHIRIIDWGKNKAGEPRSLVRISAPILRDVPPNPEVYQYLMREAPENWFGTYSVADDPVNKGKLSIVLVHTLLGDFLDEDELSAALFGVLNGANDVDETVQQKFGGKRWADV